MNDYLHTSWITVLASPQVSFSKVTQIRNLVSRQFQGAVIAAGLLIAFPTGALTEGVPSGEAMTVFEPILEPFIDLHLANTAVALPFPVPGESSRQERISFALMGNATATVSAQPTSTIQIGGRTLGEASNGFQSLGFDVSLDIARRDEAIFRDGQRASNGPGAQLTADLRTEGDGGFDLVLQDRGKPQGIIRAAQLQGEIIITTDASWTIDGQLPLPGTYAGQVTITLAVGN